MRLGITGLSGAGKWTVFEALTRTTADPGHRQEDRIGTISVPDSRVDDLSRRYQPKKTTYAQVEYFLPGIAAGKDKKGQSPSAWTSVRDCDALIHVIRNFSAYGLEKPDPLGDFFTLDQEMILADLLIVEKRLERLELDRKRGKPNPEETDLLKACHEKLEKEIPLRHFPELATAPLLRGFALVSAKPMLVLFNNEDEDDQIPEIPEQIAKESCMVIRGKLESELGQMSGEEAEAFLKEFDIPAPATDRVIRQSYDLLGLISFFTVGKDEVKAWTIKEGTDAQNAAGTIHTDMKKGFIRAEVLSYQDLVALGTFQEARKRGKVRLEGKNYIVQDGDIIEVRFNV